MKNLDLQKLIFENYLYIVSGLVLGVIIVGSYKYYNFTIEEKSAKAGDLYEILSKTSDDEEIYNISEKIIEEYNDTVYSIFTRLYLAKHYHGKNDYQKAQSHLSFIIDNDFSKNYKELAKIRLSRVYISQDNYEQALEVINTVDETSSFISMIYEIKGDISKFKNNNVKALEYYEKALETNVINKDTLLMKINSIK